MNNCACGNIVVFREDKLCIECKIKEDILSLNRNIKDDQLEEMLKLVMKYYNIAWDDGATQACNDIFSSI